jgi:hypothetical protein
LINAAKERLQIPALAVMAGGFFVPARDSFNEQIRCLRKQTANRHSGRVPAFAGVTQSVISGRDAQGQAT